MKFARNKLVMGYYGTSIERNGVAIAVAERFRHKISFVVQISDRLMAVKIYAGNKSMHMVTVCVSQAGCSISLKGISSL